MGRSGTYSCKTMRVKCSGVSIQKAGNKSVILLKRFDRKEKTRIPFLSAMSMLNAIDNDTQIHSYLDIADAIRQYGSSPKEDLIELWKRVVFSILISNTDDHLRNHEDQQKIFDNAKEYNKRHIIKCLNLFRLTNGLAGKEIIKILKDIAKENPDYKMGYSTYLKWKSAYFRQGLTGLLKSYPPPKNKSLTTRELLEEFEKIYLTPKRYSARIAWEILKTKYPEKQIPSVQSFHRAINKAYSQEYINKKRSECFKLPELNATSSTKTNKITYEKVKDIYTNQVVMVILGTIVLAFGVFLELKANLMYVPGEGIVRTITQKTKSDFGKNKLIFDVSLCLGAIFLSLIFLHTIQGLREGTIISAFLTGIFVAMFNKIFKIKPSA